MKGKLLLSLLLLSASPAHSETISIAAIDWCPQICPEKQNQGFVIDIVKRVFEQSPYELDINYYPWSRAIFLTESGKVDALLSPAKAEAPALNYPVEEVGEQRMCFFTRHTSRWHYNGTASLKGLQIGIATNTSIEELNEYVTNNPEQFQYRPYFDKYVIQSAAKLDKQRMDTFLFTYNTTMFELREQNVADNYRVAGCVSSAKIYMAFTNKARLSKNAKVMSYFDQQMARFHLDGTIDEIMAQYQLSSWRDAELEVMNVHP
ncbi:substrate-binding periplasmic protein [Shewanella waksmanii]|uniref:substrate-binding periplasmic protein n=1 Tax=Shewanella waksmanii TaxID=213783 RepID=UPI0037354FF5